MDNETEEVPVALPWVRISGGISYAVLSATGIVLNCFLATVLYKGRKSFRKNAFFTITWQILAFDLMNHTVAFFIAIPLTLAGYNVYGNSMFYLIVCAFETFSYTGTLVLSFVMTMNRITVFILPSANQFLFHKHLYFVMFSAWLLDAAFVATWNAFGCYKNFNTGGYYYEHYCPPDKLAGEFIHMLFVNVTTWLPVIMFVTYIVMLIFIKFKLDFAVIGGKIVRKEQANQTNQKVGANMKMEFQLLAQAFLICGFLEVESIVFNVIPQVHVEGQWVYLINFIGSCTSLLLSCIHPLILFTFNTEIRGRLFNLFGSTKVIGLGNSGISTASVQTLRRGTV